MPSTARALANPRIACRKDRFNARITRLTIKILRAASVRHNPMAVDAEAADILNAIECLDIRVVDTVRAAYWIRNQRLTVPDERVRRDCLAHRLDTAAPPSEPIDKSHPGRQSTSHNRSPPLRLAVVSQAKIWLHPIGAGRHVNRKLIRRRTGKEAQALF